MSFELEVDAFRDEFLFLVYLMQQDAVHVVFVLPVLVPGVVLLASSGPVQMVCSSLEVMRRCSIHC